VGVVGVRWVRWRSNFELDLFCGVVGMVDWGTFGSFAVDNGGWKVSMSC
jgi:hypothetical protein